VELTFTAKSFDAGATIDIQLRGPDFEDLKASAALVREALAQYPGVVDIKDTFRAGKQEVQLTLLPEARNLGLTVKDMGRQVRQAFYGEEAQRIQRGRDDVRVMVRFPEAERNSLGSLENMRIRTQAGIEVPFASVADMTLSQGYSTIKREDGARIIRVIADVDRSVITPEEVLRALGETTLKDIVKEHPGISYRMAGEAEENENAVRTLGKNSLLALLVIYALLAIPLHSYLQPLVVMFSIPFGAIGAIIGHYLIGADLVFFSLLGMVALSGVVVNSSLVLVDYINRQRSEGVDIFKAVSQAGHARFRPIVLTSLTTFAGLAPLINTPSMAVKFFMAMAVSLAYGVLIATAITLFLVPCMYLILDDGHKLVARLKGQ
jgi:multidrug efflux pump subunit AcrB